MKKAVSMALAAVLALAMTAVAFAADYKAVSQVESLGYAYSADTVSRGVVDLGTISPGTTRQIPLVYAMFSGDVPEDKEPGDRLEQGDIRTAGLAARTSNVKGAAAMAAPTIDTRNGAVLVTFADSAPSGGLEFDITVYLTVDGANYQSLGLTFTGTLKSDSLGVYNDDKYMDISDGRVIEAMERVQRVELYLGNGVSVFTSLTQGRTYSGTTSRTPNDADDRIFTRYADVADVIHLTTTGLQQDGDVVKLDTSINYFVYDGSLNLLGRSSEMMPYRDTYYLSETNLDTTSTTDASSAASSGEDTGASSDVEEPSGAGNGDGGAGNNAGGDDNYYNQTPGGTTDLGENPDTGDSRALGAAAATALVALAAAVVLLRKGKHKA